MRGKLRALMRRKIAGIPVPVLLLALVVGLYIVWKRRQADQGTLAGQDPTADANTDGATMDYGSPTTGSPFVPSYGPTPISFRRRQRRRHHRRQLPPPPPPRKRNRIGNGPRPVARTSARRVVRGR